MAFLGSLGKFLNLETSEAARIGANIATGNIAGAIGEGVRAVATPIRGTQQGQAVAVSQATQTRPQETQASGESVMQRPIYQNNTFMPPPPMQPMQSPMQAGFGLAAPLTQLARRFAPEIIGGLGIGAGAAVAPVVMDMFGQPKKLRVTRKLKSQVRQAVELVGIEGAAEAMGVDVQTVMYILTKKMRNDGAYVTKAAVRKTRQTVRKMKNLCDMYDDLRPAAKRRAPARRVAAGTRITQVK